MGCPWMYRMRARVVTKKMAVFHYFHSCGYSGEELCICSSCRVEKKGKGELKVGILKECKTTQKKGWVLWNGKELDQKIVIYSSLEVI